MTEQLRNSESSTPQDADAIIVGSGPSGVSAAFPLLAAGMRVLMLDGGKQRPEGSLRKGPYHRLRRESQDQWRAFLGERLEALRSSGPPSPKFDAPGSRFAFEGFPNAQGIEGQDFTVVGSLARGGLSTIWGAGVAIYDDDDLGEFPYRAADLAPSYARVATRIGVSGFADDDLTTGLDAALPTQPPLQLAENATRILNRYERKRSAVQRCGLRLGRPRTAVLTEARGTRGACTRCDMCVWGCSEDAIYSAAHDLETLKQHPNFDYRPGCLVRRVRRSGGGHRLDFVEFDGRAKGTVAAKRVLLAASTLATTRLVLEMQGRFDEEIRLIGTPAVGFALCLPERVGSTVSRREYSMGQVSFIAEGQPGQAGDDAFGSLFPASGLPGSLVVDRMPLTRPGAIRLFRQLQPSLLLGNGFLPGRYSRNTARLERTPGDSATLRIHGGVDSQLPDRLRQLRRQLRRGFRKLGAYGVPRSFTTLTPGEDLRYCGTLPAVADPGPGQVDPLGEVHGSPGLHVVDLSAFPTMPAKHHSLTLMANADRIGVAIASRFKTETHIA